MRKEVHIPDFIIEALQNIADERGISLKKHMEDLIIDSLRTRDQLMDKELERRIRSIQDDVIKLKNLMARGQGRSKNTKKQK